MNKKNEGAHAPDTAENLKPLASDEASRNLAELASFLRSAGLEEQAFEVEQSAQLARAAIEEPQPEEAQEHEAEIPEWGRSIKNIDEVFIPKNKRANVSPDLWEPYVDKTGRGDQAVLEVKYKRLADYLSPGVGQNEQAVPLDPINNTFTVDEWEYVAKPILERYLKALKLRRYSFLVDSEKKKVAGEVKRLLRDVFPANEQIPELSETELLGKKFKNKVNNLINEVNTNPEVLKDWLKAMLEEKQEAPVEENKIEKGKAKKSLGKYKKTWEIGGLGRIRDKFKKDKSENDFEKYMDELAGKISKIGSQILYLNTKYRSGIYKVPEIKKDYVETPYMKTLLKELTEKAERQLEKKKGMVSIIGDMGTGKNYIVEHFAAKTGRPYFYFPCSKGMDPADLGFHFEYKKGESIVVPSALARGLKTKNSVILIDEPNALPPEVVAALHGLADHNRAFVYNGVSFKAAEGVVIVMTMNPGTYAHVKSLPEAFSDRTLGQDMYMDYPPLTKLDKLAQEKMLSKEEREQANQADNTLEKYYVCDEAMILRKAFPALKDFSDEEFAKLWDAIINNAAVGGLEEKLSKQINSIKPYFETILRILKVCDNWRKKYKNQDMNRTISLRGAIAVAERFNEIGDVKKAFLSLYQPNSLKYDGGPEDYESLQQILNDTAELKMSLNEILGVK